MKYNSLSNHDAMSASFWDHCDPCSQNGLGKLVVMGSAHIFHDQYIDKEENNKLQEVIFRWLTSDDITLNTIDGEDPEVSYPDLKFVVSY